MKEKVLVVGSGFMAKEYLKVLTYLNYDVIVVGRGEEKIEILKKLYPQFTYYLGGLDYFLEHNADLPELAINTVNIEHLKDTTCSLLQSGIKNILVEKPGDIYDIGLLKIAELEANRNAKVLIAYNRRFYSSVLTLLNQVEIDGGVISAHFEFTEWIHTINPNHYNKAALSRWILSNSSHVIDTVFSIIGNPHILNAIIQGQNNLDWHPSGTLFVGSGISEKNIPFTYHSNWEGPGRWAVEISTKKRRFYLKPMEKLQEQLNGTVQLCDVPLDDKLDIDFKPGLFLQTKNFLEKKFNGFQTLQNQVNLMKAYYKIGGYSNV